MCGECDDDPLNDCIEDCLGVWGGSAVEDECGVCDGDGSSCGDDGGAISGGCDLPENNIHLSGGDVWYNANFDIGGFQWNVDGATVTGTSGGDAAAAGFTVQGAGSTVLGFSFTGSTIPAGCGTLTQMALSGDATGLSGIVFSDATGTQVDVSYFDGSDYHRDNDCEILD